MNLLFPLTLLAAQPQDRGILVEGSEALVRFSEWLLWFVQEFKLLAIHFLFALIWAGIAQGKGRSGVFWFTMAAVFPVLSWLLILVLPVKR